MQSEDPNNTTSSEKAHLVARYGFDSSLYLAYFIIVLISCLILSSLLILRLFIAKPEPQYLAVPQSGRLYELPPSNEPSLSLATLNNWVANVAIQTHTYDFNNITSSISDSKKYFTDAGYQSYLTAVASFRDEIVSNQLIVSSFVRAAPVVQKNFITKERYQWAVEVPITLTYSSAAVNARVEKRNLNLVVERVDSINNPYGIAISAFKSERG